MKLDLEIINPFGPKVLVSQCPDKILNKINDFVTSVENDEEKVNLYSSLSKNIPNLLLRDFENIFLPYEFCVEIGLKKLIEELTNFYAEQYGFPDKYKLCVIPPTQVESFSKCEEIIYSDCWVNRSYSGHHTPIHQHGSEISGVIFLKIPVKELHEESTRDIESQGRNYSDHYDTRDSGQLLFIYGSNQTFCDNIWKPEQMDGKIIIFPSWLQHLVYPHNTDKERRTLSFNTTFEDNYYDIMNCYYEDYQGD